MSDAKTRPHPVKFRIVQLLRSTGLLKLADQMLYLRRRMKYSGANKEFLAAHPDFTPPPAHLAFDAYNHVSHEIYWESGKNTSKAFCEVIDKEFDRPVSVLEFGCGPARLIRHFPDHLGDKLERLVGVDYNKESIEWCRKHIDKTEFEVNQLDPPLPFPDESFDVIYHFSVFTHLSRDVQIAWVNELKRLLKPGGVMLPTTHGEGYTHLLSSQADIEKYEAGELVEQGGYKEGKKWFFAIHPPAFVRDTLLKDFSSVEFIGAKPENDIHQDLWIARK